jgi:diguanylate cyclase
MASRLRDQLYRLWRWYAPRPPQSIADALQAAQLDNVRSQAPMLLLVAAINVAIIMAVCWNNGLPMGQYGWMAGLIAYCVVRIAVWSRLIKKPIPPERATKIIKANVLMTLAMMTLLSTIVSVTYAFNSFGHELLIPVSLAFGTMAIAHCFYTLKPAAIGVLFAGIGPVAASLIGFGDFNAAMVGVSMLTVALLMVRFVAEQHDRLLSGLFLEHQIRELANSDPLTGLPNRRAIMAAIEREVSRNRSYGVALLDLDGFKEVNDSLGHQAGDLMLLGVGARLCVAARPSDQVGRLGGDEFIVLFRDVTDKADLAERCTDLLIGLCHPIDLDGVKVPLAASLGYALSPDDGDNIRAVMHAADEALYAEKRTRKNQRRRDAA